MRKLLISVALACMLVIMSVATALAAASVSGPSSVEQGETISITVSSDAPGFSANIAATGLDIQPTGSQMVTTDTIILMGVMGQDSFTFRCVVTGDPGTTVSFELYDAQESDGETETPVSVQGWSATVKPTVTDPPTDPVTPPPTDPVPPSDDPNVPVMPPTNPNRPVLPDHPTLPPSDSVPPTMPTIGPVTPPVALPVATPSPGTGAGTGGQPPAGAGGTKSTPKPTASVPGGMPKTADATSDLWMMFAVACVCAGLAVLAARRAFNRR